MWVLMTSPFFARRNKGESMMALSNIVIRTVVVMGLQSLWLVAAHAQTAGSGTPFSKEIVKQESIYQSKGDQVPTGYSVDRSLVDYTRGLAAEFGRDLATLRPTDRWLDIGAGQGQAILDYYAPGNDALLGRAQVGKKAKAAAISIEDRRTPVWHQTAASLDANQIQYFFGKRFGEYSAEELGKFKVITDVLGGFSYTENIAQFMEKALRILEVNGSFYTVLQDVGAESDANRPFYPNSRFLTEIANADSGASSVKVCAWLKSITCVKVSCELRTDWKPPIEVYRIHKECENVTVPELATVHYQAGTPPERRFQLRSPLPVSAAQGGATR